MNEQLGDDGYMWVTTYGWVKKQPNVNNFNMLPDDIIRVIREQHYLYIKTIPIELLKMLFQNKISLTVMESISKLFKQIQEESEYSIEVSCSTCTTCTITFNVDTDSKHNYYNWVKLMRSYHYTVGGLSECNYIGHKEYKEPGDIRVEFDVTLDDAEVYLAEIG